jgi:hypothetical protein
LVLYWVPFLDRWRLIRQDLANGSGGYVSSHFGYKLPGSRLTQMAMDLLGTIMFSLCCCISVPIVPSGNQFPDYLGLESKEAARGWKNCFIPYGNRTYAPTDLHKISPPSIQGDFFSRVC